MTSSTSDPAPLVRSKIQVSAADSNVSRLQQAVPIRFTKLFINGEWVDSIKGATMDVFSPLTGEKLCSVSEAQSEDVDVAVKHARHCFENVWTKISAHERSILMFKLADLMESHLDELAALDSFDNGKAFAVAKAFDVTEAIKTIRYFAGWCTKNVGQTIPVEGDFIAYTRHEPIGVVGAITPFNFPLLMLIWKMGPLLACGNVVVLKSSEKTPLSALLFAELCREAGFPPGVVNVLSGYGPTAGNALAVHMDVDKLAFTGSGPTGRKLMIASAQSNLKKVTLELGGKSPSIIFPDADLELAVRGSILGIYFNGGQVCCAGSRVYVHESIYEEYLQKVSDIARETQMSNKSNEAGAIQPMVDSLQHSRVSSYIEVGKSEGARLMAGGGTTHGGSYVEPTIFGDVTDDMRICREEIFGPVLSVLKFSTIDDVIARANASEFGLAASVFTTDVVKAQYVSSKLKAGTVWINVHNKLYYNVPFGGFKQSGFGRDLGSYALTEYSQVKAVISYAPTNTDQMKIDIRK